MHLPILGNSTEPPQPRSQGPDTAVPAGAAEAQPRHERLDVPITGMTCAGCAARIERTLQSLPGIHSASVNFATRTATALLDPHLVQPQAVINAIASLGYSATLPAIPSAEGAADEAAHTLQQESREIRSRLLVALIFGAPVVLLAMTLGMSRSGAHSSLLHWTQLVLSLPVILYSGKAFFRHALRGIATASASMDTLITLGVLASFSLSCIATVSPSTFASIAGHPPVYFEASVSIIAMVLVGKWLESRALVKAGSAITGLLSLQPPTALVVHADGVRQVPVDSVRPGDEVEIPPGARVPVDGTVRSGASSIDQSMLSGESLPVEKSAGDPVFAGTLNTSGSLRITATRVGTGTTLRQIVRLVREAQGGKAPVSRLADRISRVFVPVVIALALLTFVLWWQVLPVSLLGEAASSRVVLAILTSVSVLIIACPCALGLATPTVIMVASGLGAQRGVIFRSAAAIETLHSISTIVFDKTGTLTNGTPQVASVSPLLANASAALRLNEDDLLTLAASAEGPSEHPLAKAIVHAASERGLALVRPSSFVAEAGHGIRAVVNGRNVRLASPARLSSEMISQPLRELMDAATDRLQTPVVVLIDETLAGLITLSDSPRPSALPAIKRLKALGLRVAMLTGDNALVARHLAQALTIDDISAEMLPADKAAHVARLRQQGQRVAMVGDGVNDAPALAAADVGLAMSTGTDIAAGAAGVTLMRADLSAIPDAIDISTATMRTIRQNLTWAFGYNLLCIPVAMGVLYPSTGWLLSPMIASGTMAMSSVCVVVNSLLLTRRVHFHRT